MPHSLQMPSGAEMAESVAGEASSSDDAAGSSASALAAALACLTASMPTREATLRTALHASSHALLARDIASVGGARGLARVVRGLRSMLLGGDGEGPGDLALQLVKSLLPYAPTPDALHQLLGMLESSGGALPGAGSSTTAAWPFALSGMLVSALASSPSIAYILFEGEQPSTLDIPRLAAAAWPPGLAAPTASSSSSSAAAAAAAAAALPSIGYSYGVWIYPEPVVDSTALDCSPSSASAPSAASPSSADSASSGTARKPSMPMLGELGRKSLSSSARAASVKSASRFVLLQLSSEDGKTGLSLVYQADTGTLSLRTGTAAVGVATTSAFSFRFGSATNPTTHEFRDVGLIPHRWCHLMLTHTRGSLTSAKDSAPPMASLYVDGVLAGSARVAYPTRAATPEQSFHAWMGSSGIDGHSGPVSPPMDPADGLRWRWRVASSTLLGVVLTPDDVSALFEAGPRVAGRLSSVLADASGASVSTTPSSAHLARVPVVDVAAGCYALPSACAEALDDVAALITRQRRGGGGCFSSVGTASVVSSSSGHHASPLSPSSLHEHLLAPAASSEQELLTQSDRAPLESDSLVLNALVNQDNVLWCFHARFAADLPKDDPAVAASSSPASPSAAHTIIYNTGCSSSSVCGDALLYGLQCASLRPQAPADLLRRVGGVRRLLALVDACCTRPSSAATTFFTNDLNPSTALRQALLLLLMALRRNPRNARDMHVLDGYRLLGFFLRSASGKRFRVRAPPPPAVTSSSSAPSSAAPSPSPSSLPPPTPPPSASPESKVRRSSLGSSTRPLLDGPIVDLLFALVGLSERGMGGYVANLLALEHLLLDHRLWERAGPDVQLHVFQGLINACVGNPDRAANIAALRAARFVPWLLVILTNTRTFDSAHGHGNGQATGQHGPRARGTLSPGHQELSLLNHILTLLRVLLMSELIDHELHLLANFAMTRPTGLASSAASIAHQQRMRSESAASSTGDDHTQVGQSRQSLQHSSHSATARRIQKCFIEMLLDVVLKIASSSDLAQRDQAMSVFNRSINFAWIFGVLKGDLPMRQVTDVDEVVVSLGATPSQQASSQQPPDADSAILTLKILLVLLESPALLQEFRSSSLDSPARPSAPSGAGTTSTDAPPFGRIISFAALSNLLLPYASCARLYPVLLCMLLGRSIHVLAGLPRELTSDTVDELFTTLLGSSPDGAPPSVALVVPEVVDILVDLLARCLHLLGAQQRAQLLEDPARFFSATAAVASVKVAKPVRAYASVHETGILSEPPPARTSKFGIDHSRWNEDREDRVQPLTRSGLANLDLVPPQISDLQALHAPASLRPKPLATGTPATTPHHGPSQGAHDFSFGPRSSGSASGSSSLNDASPSPALLNGLVLFFMRLLPVCEDFGRVASRSTFLRPIVAAAFAAAHLNPILATWQAAPSQLPPRPSSAQSSRTTASATVGMNRFGHVPLPPLASARLSTGPTLTRAQSSVDGSLGVRRSSGTLVMQQQQQPLASPDPAAGPSPFSPDSRASFSPVLSPDSSSGVHIISALGSPSLSSASASSYGLLSPEPSPSPTLASSSGSPQSASPPVVLRMELMSPHGFESPRLSVLASPQYIALQQAQLASLTAPASPPSSPTSRRWGPSAASTAQALALTIDAPATPSAAQAQALFYGQLFESARAATPGVLFSPPPSSSPAAVATTLASPPTTLVANSSDSPFTFLPTIERPSDSPTNSTSSIRIPIFRHSTSQLLLRFLRQVVLYHLQHKKDGWMILDKVLDSFPSAMTRSEAAQSDDPADTAAARGVASYHANEELVRGFQSALLSILLIRVQEKLAAPFAPPTGTNTATPVSLAPNPSPTSLINNMFVCSTPATTSGGPVQVAPTKFLTNLARAIEVVFLKIQCGMFVSAHWSLAGLDAGADSAPGEPRPSGSTVGLLTVLMGLLKHEGLRAAVDELAASSVAMETKVAPRRRSSTFGPGGTMGSAMASLASPINRALRTLHDIAMNCVLHLYDQFTLKELSLLELVRLNRLVHAHRRVVLGDYLLTAHVSSYISAANTLVSMATVPSGPAATAAGATCFTSRSFAACMLYHLYYFQLSTMSADELEQAQRDAGHTAGDARDSRSNSESEPTQTASSSSSSGCSLGATDDALGELKTSALGLLIWLVRSKPTLMGDLMKASVTALSSVIEEERPPQTSRRSSSMVSELPSVTYDLFNKGFDTLLSGFAALAAPTATQQQGGPSSTRPRSVSSPHHRSSAEVDGFFAWLSIQRPIVSKVFSRTLLPEWKAYCKFCNGFLYAASGSVLARVGKMAERDAENVQIDLDEISALHESLTDMLRQATQVDNGRYLRRLQALVEQEATMRKQWRAVRDDLLKLYAMYSNSRRLNHNMPSRREWTVNYKATPRRKASGTGSRKSSASDLGLVAGPAATGSSESEGSDSNSDSELLVSPSAHTWRQPWKIDPSECASRMRVRLVRSVLAPPDASLFTFPYKRSADEAREARAGQQAFRERQNEARAEARRAAASVPLITREGEDERPELQRPHSQTAPTTHSDPIDEPEPSPPSIAITAATELPSPAQLTSSHDESLVASVPRRSSDAEAEATEGGERVPELLRVRTFAPSSLSAPSAPPSPQNGTTSPGSSSGKQVPESSERPVPLRRVQSLALAPPERKRRGSFFNGALVASPRAPTTPQALEPPSPSPLGERAPLPHLYSQASFRRTVSFSQDISPRDAMSPPSQLSSTSPANMTLQQQAPPTLLVDTPANAGRGGGLSTFGSPLMTQTPTPNIVAHALPPSALSVLLEPVPSASASHAQSHAHGHHAVAGDSPGFSPNLHEDEDICASETSAYSSTLLPGEDTWFLYEERLRLLLDAESISYHYNCLRISGLEEVSAIFLLCASSLFIVDAYQVQTDGSIVRLKDHHETGEKNRLVQDTAPAGSDDGDEEAEVEPTSRRWSYSDIVSVHKRRYLLRPAALELFFADQTNYLLVVNVKQREQVYKNLLALCTNLTDGMGGPSSSSSANNGTLTAADLVAPNMVTTGGTLGRDASARFSADSIQLQILSAAAAGGATASSNTPVGLGVGVGGLTSGGVEQTVAPSGGVGGRLTSNLSSLFFANHSLGTEGSIAHLSTVVAATLDTFTLEWQHGFLSSFDYLMLLNGFSGRSFNDLTQYPVFPWVLDDYDSPQLDLHDPRSFRDLSKPMAALDEARAAAHRQKYRETEALWRDEERESASGGGGPHARNPSAFLAPGVSRAYNSAVHYSSAAAVMYYLLRCEPFTQMHVSFQSGRFDRADRLFSSVKQTYLAASRLLSGDVKELVPEFFYCPALLRNGNALDLGTRQDGRHVDHVLLPPWARGSSREFIRLHRLAFESPHVSAHLHEWIDLVFGASQTGEAAVKALNVFHFVTYVGAVDVDRISDPLARSSFVEQIRSFGQTPAALFTKPHPPRLVQPRAGRLLTDPHALQPTDTARFPHAVSQIFLEDRTMLLSGVGGHATSTERILVCKPGHLLAVPSLQPVNSFLPYAVSANPACVSSRDVRALKSYRTAPVYNKLSIVQWDLPDGSLRAGLLDLGVGGAGGLEHGMSCPSSSSTPSSAATPTVRSLKAYLNMADGVVRVAAVPLEGDDGTLVTGGDDCLVCVWTRDTATEEYVLVGELSGHRRPVRCVLASKSFGLLISGSDDGAVILWDLARMVALRTLRHAPHGAAITHLALNLATGDLTAATAHPPGLWVTDVNGVLLARYPDPRALQQPAAEVPRALRRDAPMDSVTALAMGHSIGHRDSLHLHGAPAALPRFDTSALVLTGHASGAVRLWHLRWLSWAELFEAVRGAEPDTHDVETTESESAPPVTFSVPSSPLALGKPLVRSQSENSSVSDLPSVASAIPSHHEIELEGQEVNLSSPSPASSEILSSPPSLVAGDRALSTGEFDGEVRSVNASAASSASSTSNPNSGATSPNAEELDPAAHVAAAQASEAVARQMSSRVFGSPGEEQLDDEYGANGLQAASAARGTDDSTARPHRQWHLVCVGELLGHQVSVSALSLTRDGSALYSGDTLGNVVHFTADSSGSPSTHAAPCDCKASRNKPRLKQHHALACGPHAGGSPAMPQRVRCLHRDCAHLACEFCVLDHVRTVHPYVSTSASAAPPTSAS